MQQNPYAPPSPEGYQPSPSPAVEPPASVSAVDSLKFAFSSQVGFGKLAMGLLLMIIPIVGPICLAGWMAETHRRLVRREAPSARSFEFNEFVNYLMAGLVPFAAQLAGTFIAMFPMMIVMGIMAAVMVPMLTSGGDAGAVVGIVMGLVFAVVMFLMMAAMVVVLTAMQVRAELTGNFPKTFDPSGIGGFVKRQWKPILGHSLLLALLAMPLMFAGLIVFFVGIYFVAVALQFAQTHLRWQIYEADVRAGGEVLPVFPGNGADL